MRERLAPGGAFVVEAFVPWDPPRPGSHVEVRSMTADRVVLAATITDPEAQTVTGQFVELSEGGPVRLHPYVLRWSRPSELDELGGGRRPRARRALRRRRPRSRSPTSRRSTSASTAGPDAEAGEATHTAGFGMHALRTTFVLS